MLMKKILTSILYCLFILILSNKSHAQACGINPGIQLIEDWPKPYYQADTSSLQPGWSIYQMEWVINNNLVTIILALRFTQPTSPQATVVSANTVIFSFLPEMRF